MILAALPAFKFNAFDGFVVVWLIIGIFRGRKRGMTQELLPALQWLAIIPVAGLFYGMLGGTISNVTNGAFTRLWANITAYLLIAFAIHLVVLWIKHLLGDKLTGSDLFGSNEYYLGMIAGLLRFACMLIFLAALMHSRIYTDAELAESHKAQMKNFDNDFFPTYGTVQHAFLSESFSGRLIVDNLKPVLISTSPAAPGRKPGESLGKKQEDAINAIIGSPKK